MSAKRKVQITVDLFMTALLSLLMAYSLIGEVFHEWAGTAMFLLFLLHHGLNWRWHKALLRGSYNGLRILMTVVNLLIFLLMLALMISGIVMSRYVFSFLPISGGAALSRLLHLVCSYWCYVLTAFHLGLHGTMLTGMLKRTFNIKSSSKALGISLKLLALLLASYGIYAFVRRDFGGYMLLQTQFVFFDYSEPPALFILDYLAIFALFTIGGHYAVGLLLHIRQKQKKEKAII